VTIVSQKARYRRQASLCYEIAAMLDGEKVAAMVHLGDVYSGLAAEPAEKWLAAVGRSGADDQPECPHCRLAMRRTHTAAPTGHLPAMDRFECRSCGETLICKQISDEI
jgi:hypothetical protein